MGLPRDRRTVPLLLIPAWVWVRVQVLVLVPVLVRVRVRVSVLPGVQAPAPALLPKWPSLQLVSKNRRGAMMPSSSKSMIQTLSRRFVPSLLEYWGVNSVIVDGGEADCGVVGVCRRLFPCCKPAARRKRRRRC